MSSKVERVLTVKEKHQLTPNMIRIVLSGDDLKGFPDNQESAYVKLLLPLADGRGVVKRSYTVRAFDAESLELTLDFVSHGDNGPASAWASSVNVADTITVAGPGPAKLVDFSADWFLLAGDMTALPAISTNLEKLPDDAKGYAVLEILSEQDKQDLSVPKGISIHWVINAHPDKTNTVLADAVKSLPWLDGVPSIWVASEFDAMRNLRAYFRKECSVERGQMYASSYWKMGETDEGNKKAKKMDEDA